MKPLRFAALPVVVLGLAAAFWTLADRTPISLIKDDMQMQDTYEIGIKEDGIFLPLARLTFDAQDYGSLTLGAPHPKTFDLVTAWSEVSTLDKIEIKTSRPLELDSGEMVSELIGVVVFRGEEEYRDTVVRHLQREYGFRYQ